MMQTAFDAGVNFFDNAEVYGDGHAETVMGNALRILNWKRSDYIISTKIFWGGKGPNQSGLSRKHIVEGIKSSLMRLQLDYVDLVFCHRPDNLTPIEETVRAMNHLINTEKALYWGTSEWTAAQIQQANACADRLNLIRPLMEQPQYSMLHRERLEVEFIPLFSEMGLGVTSWSPLCSGLLTGKYNHGSIPVGSRLSMSDFSGKRKMIEGVSGDLLLAKFNKIEKLAHTLGASMSQLAIAWCAVNPNVSSVILGASSLTQLKENLQALNVIPKITPGIMDAIDEILENKPAQPYQFRRINS